MTFQSFSLLERDFRDFHSQDLLWRFGSLTTTYCNTLQHMFLPARAWHQKVSHSRLCYGSLFVWVQRTSIHCNTLQQTATHCNTLQHTATHCNTLQHTCPPTWAWHRRVLHLRLSYESPFLWLQHTATHCNTLQHTATHMSTCSSVTSKSFTFEAFVWKPVSLIATHCNTLQHTERHISTCSSVTSKIFTFEALLCRRLCSLICNLQSSGTKRCVAVCCSVLQRVAVCCRMLQCAAV